MGFHEYVNGGPQNGHAAGAQVNLVLALTRAPFPIAMALVKLLELTSAPNSTAVLLLPVILVPSALPPIAVLLLPAVLAKSAEDPAAVLSLLVVLENMATTPVAVFWMPVVLKGSVLCPIAVLELPVVLNWSAPYPVAVSPTPVVFFVRASTPTPVLQHIPVIVRFPAFAPAKKLLVPKLCMNRFPSDMISPVVAVLASDLKLPVISSCSLGAAVPMAILSVRSTGDRLPVPAPDQPPSRSTGLHPAPKG